MKRISCCLTAEEIDQFNRLRPVDGAAVTFWKAVADARGLDYATLLCYRGRPYEFTALPWGHGKPWCWPMEAKCKANPVEFTGGMA